jgi:hypothetical protein
MTRRQASSIHEYLRSSKAWEQAGLTLGTARALVNAGFLTVEDLQGVPAWELAAVPRVGKKSLVILLKLMAQQNAYRSPPSAGAIDSDVRSIQRIVGASPSRLRSTMSTA